MTDKQTGGPAFPQYIISNNGAYVDGGMTLLDYFAIRAFQTRLSKHHDWTLTELTEQSYRDADAMLKVRDGQT